jgi:hypothetical protein
MPTSTSWSRKSIAKFPINIVKEWMFSSLSYLFSSIDCIYLSWTQLLPSLLKLSSFIFIGFYVKHQMHIVPCERGKHVTILNTAVQLSGLQASLKLSMQPALSERLKTPVLQAGRLWFRFLMKSLDFSIGPGIHSASDRNFLGVKGGWCVKLTTSVPSMSWLTIKCGNINVSQPYGPPRPVARVSFTFLKVGGLDARSDDFALYKHYRCAIQRCGNWTV